MTLGVRVWTSAVRWEKLLGSKAGNMETKVEVEGSARIAQAASSHAQPPPPPHAAPPRLHLPPAAAAGRRLPRSLQPATVRLPPTAGSLPPAAGCLRLRLTQHLRGSTSRRPQLPAAGSLGPSSRPQSASGRPQAPSPWPQAASAAPPSPGNKEPLLR
ncbi:potassium/sodium hyperpolarization-activated cyclic nucleotide-gated channel 2-like [Setaria italica]|uniref:potassium/sodium hyperpolarization-activated cyclic nucleotide-gated channel 2-like n=1 Tax=Setaria italica TaxID=4555 RepID=UPI000350E48A|nr:potassium/sodium hyperpolarization-activated cyclic nucleotide-gated channel 2-like [Setaria italica]